MLASGVSATSAVPASSASPTSPSVIVPMLASDKPVTSGMFATPVTLAMLPRPATTAANVLFLRHQQTLLVSLMLLWRLKFRSRCLAPQPSTAVTELGFLCFAYFASMTEMLVKHSH